MSTLPRIQKKLARYKFGGEEYSSEDSPAREELAYFRGTNGPTCGAQTSRQEAAANKGRLNHKDTKTPIIVLFICAWCLCG